MWKLFAKRWLMADQSNADPTLKGLQNGKHMAAPSPQTSAHQDRRAVAERLAQEIDVNADVVLKVLIDLERRGVIQLVERDL